MDTQREMEESGAMSFRIVFTLAAAVLLASCTVPMQPRQKLRAIPNAPLPTRDTIEPAGPSGAHTARAKKRGPRTRPERFALKTGDDCLPKPVALTDYLSLERNLYSSSVMTDGCGNLGGGNRFVAYVDGIAYPRIEGGQCEDIGPFWGLQTDHYGAVRGAE